jgi:hypothetical protein
MSLKAGLCYRLGVALAHGSYFASRGLGTLQVQALKYIKDDILGLQKEGIPISLHVADNIHFYKINAGIKQGLGIDEIHPQFVQARGAYRDEVYKKSRYGPLYDFGEAVGLWEGQASAGPNDAAAVKLAKQAMAQAKTRAGDLTAYGIGPSDVPGTTDHKKVLNLRKKWQSLLDNSPVF